MSTKEQKSKQSAASLDAIKESTVESSNLGELDVPTDEVAAAAEQIKQDVTQQLHDAEQQIEQSFSSFKQTIAGLMDADKTTLIRKQKATSIQWWHDFNHEGPVAKVLLGCLLFTNLALPILFLNHRESWLVMSCYACVSIISHFLYQTTPARSPDRFITSLMSHLLWVPMLFWLSSRLSSTSEQVSRSTSLEHVDVALTLFLSKGFYISSWMKSVLAVNSIVLLCDVIKMMTTLKKKMSPVMKSRSIQHAGHAHIQTKPHISEHGKHALIDNADDDVVNRKQHQEGIKQRLSRHAPAPTA